MDNSLRGLPNIGKTLEEKLIKAGIASADQLKEMGSLEAFRRIRAGVDTSSCLSMLFALEGAVQGIRWHELHKEFRDKLTQEAKKFIR